MPAVALDARGSKACICKKHTLGTPWPRLRADERAVELTRALTVRPAAVQRVLSGGGGLDGGDGGDGGVRHGGEDLSRGEGEGVEDGGRGAHATVCRSRHNLEHTRCASCTVPPTTSSRQQLDGEQHRAGPPTPPTRRCGSRRRLGNMVLLLRRTPQADAALAIAAVRQPGVARRRACRCRTSSFADVTLVPGAPDTVPTLTLLRRSSATHARSPRAAADATHRRPEAHSPLTGCV